MISSWHARVFMRNGAKTGPIDSGLLPCIVRILPAALESETLIVQSETRRKLKFLGTICPSEMTRSVSAFVISSERIQSFSFSFFFRKILLYEFCHFIPIAIIEIYLSICINYY